MEGIHDFWLVKGDPVKRLETMAELRSYVSDLNDMQMAFTKSDISDEIHHKNFIDEMLWMIGSWRVPEPFQRGDNKADQWINPNYTDKDKFPASYAYCDCGALLSRGFADGSNKFQVEHDHDGCSVIDRLRARAEMLERRKEVLLRGLRLGRSGRQLAAQIGIEAKGLGEISKALNIDMKREKDHFRELSGRTYIEFIRRGVDNWLIAKAYDVHPDTLRRRAQEHTDTKYIQDEQKWTAPWVETDDGEVFKFNPRATRRGDCV